MNQAPHPAGNGFRELTAADMPAFVNQELLSGSRELPVLAVTTEAHSEQAWLDPATLTQEFAEVAQVVLIRTGDATWALSAALPPRLDVYGGAVRLWWPGLTEQSEPRAHPLLFVYSSEEAPRVLDRLRRLLRPRLAVRDAPATPPTAAPPAARPPSPWQHVAREYQVGDVVPGRVVALEPHVLVELLPGAAGLVPEREVDWTFVSDVADLLTIGEAVTVELLELDPERPRCIVSIKRAIGKSVTKDARGDESPSVAASPAEDPDAAAAEVEELRHELHAVNEDRDRLVQRGKQLVDRRIALEKEVRSLKGRLEAALKESAGQDPLSDERAFLRAVRISYARHLGEADRQQYPLPPIKVGPKFLERLRALKGVRVDKVVDVCAEVACGRAVESTARQVHPLRDGVGGAPTVTRARDGAKAWRCSLQDNTASARRLHWWSIPGPPNVIEFASVGVHDQLDMPE